MTGRSLIKPAAHPSSAANLSIRWSGLDQPSTKRMTCLDKLSVIERWCPTQSLGKPDYAIRATQKGSWRKTPAKDG